MQTMKQWNLNQSIRAQLIFAIAICFIAAFLVFAVSYSFSDWIWGEPDHVFYMEAMAEDLAHELEDYDLWKDQAAVKKLMEANSNEQRDILLVSMTGEVLYRTTGASDSFLDISRILSDQLTTRWHLDWLNAKEAYYHVAYPFYSKTEQGYVVVKGTTVGTPPPMRDFQQMLLQLALSLGTFIGLFFLLTNGKMRYFEQLAGGLLEISKGKLGFRVPEKSRDELGSLAANINYMAEELQRKIEAEKKAENAKYEWITSLSHDLKTPLTSIIGYLRLVKDKKYTSAEQHEQYVRVAFDKSEKLEGLLDHMLEYTKLTNPDLTIRRETVCINEFLEQLVEEMTLIADMNQTTFKKEIPEEGIRVEVDPEKMVRVFENLLMNAVKYGDKKRDITVRLYREEDQAVICVQNFGDPLKEKDLEQLFNRFYRIDRSRSPETGGSGLGLSIAKNIVEKHGGEIWAESEGRKIRFYVKLGLVRVP